MKQINVMGGISTNIMSNNIGKVNEQSTTVQQTVFDAFEERAIKSGQVTRDQIVTILNEFQTGIRNDVQTQIATLKHHGFGGVHQPLPHRNNQLLHLEQESVSCRHNLFVCWSSLLGCTRRIYVSSCCQMRLRMEAMATVDAWIYKSK